MRVLALEGRLDASSSYLQVPRMSNYLNKGACDVWEGGLVCLGRRPVMHVKEPRAIYDKDYVISELQMRVLALEGRLDASSSYLQVKGGL